MSKQEEISMAEIYQRSLEGRQRENTIIIGHQLQAMYRDIFVDVINISQ